MKTLLLLTAIALISCNKSEYSTGYEPPKCERVAWIDTIGQEADTIYNTMDSCSEPIEFRYLGVKCKNRQVLCEKYQEYRGVD